MDQLSAMFSGHYIPLFSLITVVVKFTSPTVIPGGFVGQVKPRGGSKNCGFALGFNPPRGFRRISWTCQTAGGEVI